MTSPYLGQISMFGGNFAPSGWAFCNGQLLSISQYTALYSLIGTYYGGDGQSTFALPNLISRLPIHVGQGIGLSYYSLGQVGGVTDVTLTMATMPGHNHPLNATTAQATTGTIGTTVLPGKPFSSTENLLFYAAQGQGQPALTPVAMAAGACGFNGSNLPHNNMMPSLCITFIIALTGAYPSRS
jgi:microcystin-dependent protein